MGLSTGARFMAATIIVSSTLAGCGRPNVSGIYLATKEREVTLVQLVDAGDGHLNGRVESVTLAPGGQVNDQAVALEGTTANNEITVLLKPMSFLQAGITATGAISGNQLTLTGRGFSLSAAKSDLKGYQSAVAKLQEKAEAERARLAAEAGKRQVAAMAAQAAANATARVQQQQDEEKRLDAASATLRNATIEFNQALDHVPDFAGRALQNTNKVEAMVAYAQNLSDQARGQVSVQANQVIVGTNQIEVARSQYAISLEQRSQPAASLAESVVGFCTSPKGAGFTDKCQTARDAALGYKKAQSRAVSLMSAAETGIRRSIEKQEEAVHHIE